MNISCEHYRIFYYAAKYENLTKAAEVLMSSQPNITRAIKNLEKELGCALFIRSRRGVKLTAEGEKLYAHISIAENQIRLAEEELTMLKDLQSGTVFIGASEVALRCFLLPVLKSFRRKYPGVHIHLSNHTTPQALSALRDFQVDIALVTTPLGSTSDLSVRELKNVREAAVCGTPFSYLTERKRSLAEISDLPLVSLGPGTKTHELYSKWFGENGLIFAPDIEASTADQILPLVENGLGIGFVPEEFLTFSDAERVMTFNIKEQIPERKICLVKREGQALSIAAESLEKMIVEH